MNATTNYTVGQKVEMKNAAGRWIPAIVVSVFPNDGPEGETLYTVEYAMNDGSLHHSGRKSAKTVRLPA